jgi:hypothetical protein
MFILQQYRRHNFQPVTCCCYKTTRAQEAAERTAMFGLIATQ